MVLAFRANVFLLLLILQYNVASDKVSASQNYVLFILCVFRDSCCKFLQRSKLELCNKFLQPK